MCEREIKLKPCQRCGEKAVDTLPAEMSADEAIIRAVEMNFPRELKIAVADAWRVHNERN